MESDVTTIHDGYVPAYATQVGDVYRVVVPLPLPVDGRSVSILVHGVDVGTIKAELVENDPAFNPFTGEAYEAVEPELEAAAAQGERSVLPQPKVTQND